MNLTLNSYPTSKNHVTEKNKNQIAVYLVDEEAAEEEEEAASLNNSWPRKRITPPPPPVENHFNELGIF